MSKYKALLTVCFLCISTLALANDLTPAFDKDVEYFSNTFNTNNNDAIDEAIVRIEWAGITDPRIFDPLVEKIKGRKVTHLLQKKYVQALAYSGNPKYKEFLTTLSNDEHISSEVRNEARKLLPLFNKYQINAENMSRETENAQTNQELWTIRYRVGLASSDRVIVRLAARDLYLFPEGTESLDLAKKILQENSSQKITDNYIVDAMSFLCKAIGLSRNPDYKDILVEVANNSPNKKLYEYAERSAQYIDPTFVAANRHFRTKK